MRDAKGRFCKAREFKVGDRVVLNTDWSGEPGSRGKAGEVDIAADAQGLVRVLFDSFAWSGLSRLYCIPDWLDPEPAKLNNPLAGGKLYNYGPANEPNPNVLDIAPGAVVRLKSGGPEMTVYKVGNEFVECIHAGPREKAMMTTAPLVCLEVVR